MKLTEISSLIPIVLSLLALLVSVRSLWFSRQANKTALIGQRLQVINLVRTAFDDVSQHAVADAKTASAIREAFQLSLLVFNSSISESLEKLYGTAFHLEHSPGDKHTERYLDEIEELKSGLTSVLDRMNSEAAVSKT